MLKEQKQNIKDQHYKKNCIRPKVKKKNLGTKSKMLLCFKDQ